MLNTVEKSFHRSQPGNAQRKFFSLIPQSSQSLSYEIRKILSINMFSIQQIANNRAPMFSIQKTLAKKSEEPASLKRQRLGKSDKDLPQGREWWELTTIYVSGSELHWICLCLQEILHDQSLEVVLASSAKNLIKQNQKHCQH